MFKSITKILGGDPNKREIQRLSEIVTRINALEESYEKLSDDALHAKTAEFKRRLANGETLDDLLPEAFAAVREASKRTIGLRHYDVQLIGGMTLHQGKIAEMRTGEGKTLVATLPLYLNALAGKGVHLVTVNDYLARRDARWKAPIYNLLGMSVGVLQMAARTENGRNAFIVDLGLASSREDMHQLKVVPRAEAYQADITYGTNAEFGFDYLRDNLTMRLEDRVQRGHYYAIVDEVDNILIDEARTPLIISGPASEDTEWYVKMAQVVRQLRPEDYEVNEKDRSVSLTEIGEAHVEELLQTPLRDPERPEDITPEQARLLGYLEQSLRAQFLYRRNKDYIVQSGKVVIVDEFTGRLMPGRRWSEGLHQAVEAKEGVKVEPENVTYATITLQNYFRMYTKLAGMTGTALTEAEEFYKIYKLDVLPIPTNLEYQASQPNSPLIEVEEKDEQGYKFFYYARRDDPTRQPRFWRRKDYPDVVYRSEEAKLRAITMEIIRFHVMGRPQLVGTTSVEHSERLSDRLQPEPLRRLAQVLILRDAWMEKSNTDIIEKNIPELQFMNKDILQLDVSELRPLARQLNISMNPEDPANVARLLKGLLLAPADEPRLLKVLQGGIPHQVLNARKHDEESLIIARAGAFGAVTIATNMAGRGVDIKLGGELPEDVLQDVIRVLHSAGYPDPYDMTNLQRQEALLKLTPEQYGIYEEQVRAFMEYMQNMERVRELGGLHVIGSERHEARRIDNQLRGRAARQGDPGSSRFYLSLEDDLMRLFGGGQAENVLKRFNFDEHLPIEINILGRLVEQSQERVEGANFDVRKHLLEYDDVLNSQRKRIYEQRDRVFTKEDLTEDVIDMLRTELQQRIPQALADEEGPWKLLAFLEEMQPPMDYDEVVYPSFATRLLLEEVKKSIPHAGDPARSLRAAMIDLAERALRAENDHILRQARQIFDRTAESLEAQRSERFDALDAFFEGIGEEEEGMQPRRPAELVEEAQALVRVPVRLQGDQLRRLAEGDREVKALIQSQVETALNTVAVNRVVMALERRLEESLNLRANQLQGIPWQDAVEQIETALEEVLTKRMARLVGEEGQIARDLDGAIQRIEGDPLSDRNLIMLLVLMAQGTKLAFDRKTHRQGYRRFTRLNYIYLSAHLLEDVKADEITATALEHLEGARAALQELYGYAEFQRLKQQDARLSMFDERMRAAFRAALGEVQFNALLDVPFNDLPPENQEVVRQVLGARLQNAIYRHLLLTVISEQWVDYLTRVEALRVSIGLEAYAQRNPLVEYKARASDMFRTLLADVRLGVIRGMFTFRPRRGSEAAVERARPEAEEEAAPAPQPQINRTGKKKRKRH